MMKLFIALLLVSQLFSLDRPSFLGMDGGVYGPDLKRLGLGTGSSLAVHGQTAYLIGTDGHLWSCTDGGEWMPLSGPAALGLGTKVVVEPSGTPLILGTDGGVYRLGKGWNRVGLAVARDLAVSESGDLFAVGTDGKIWTCGVNQSEWTLFNGLVSARKLAVGGGSVYLVGTDNGIYRVGSQQVERLGLATGQDISVNSSGRVVAIVGMDNGVYLFQNGNWSRLGAGLARQVSWPR